MNSRMGYDVFLSHSSLDAGLANAICTSLEERGIRCWLAPRDIPPGRDWAHAVIDGLLQCKLVVLVLSSRAGCSNQVLNEIAVAVDHDIPVLPFQIEDFELPKAFVFYLSRMQRINAVSLQVEPCIKRLCDEIAVRLKDPRDHRIVDTNSGEPNRRFENKKIPLKKILHLLLVSCLAITFLIAWAPTGSFISHLIWPETEPSSWMADPVTGIKVWNFSPQRGESIRWFGGSYKGLADGPGVLHWYRAGEYHHKTEGIWDQGKLKEGTRATNSFPDGSVRSGTVRWGLIEFD